MTQQTADQTVRVGVFNTTDQASRAIDGLLRAGFTKHEISVLCSDERKEEFFADFSQPPLPESHLRGAIATGGTLGAVIGGLVGIAAITTTAGVGLLAAGPILVAMGGGAVAGGLVGAMSTRGVTKEMADYYDQAVTRGKILVAIEDGHDDARLATAERIFYDAGAEPLPLRD